MTVTKILLAFITQEFIQNIQFYFTITKKTGF